MPTTGTYYLTADDAEGLVVRPASTSDDAIPNPNAIIAQNLIRLAAFTGEPAFRDKADRLIEGVLAQGGDNLFAHVSLLNAIDMRLNLARDRGDRRRRRTAARRGPGAAASQPRGAARAFRRRIAGVASGAGEDQGVAGGRRLHLHRRDLLAAGDIARRDRAGL